MPLSLLAVAKSEQGDVHSDDRCPLLPAIESLKAVAGGHTSRLGEVGRSNLARESESAAIDPPGGQHCGLSAGWFSQRVSVTCELCREVDMGAGSLPRHLPALALLWEAGRRCVRTPVKLRPVGAFPCTGERDDCSDEPATVSTCSNTPGRWNSRKQSQASQADISEVGHSDRLSKVVSALASGAVAGR